MVVSNTNTKPLIRMRLQVIEEGIVAIDLHTMGIPLDQHHSFEFLTPISLPEGREVLTKLFRLFRASPQDTTPAARALAPSITGTPLFRYLQECEERFAVLPQHYEAP